MKQKYLRVGKSKLSYYVFGNGDKTMLMFHGYGQDALLYSDLPEKFLEDYRCISIDLFGHGCSSFYHEEQINPEGWGEFIESLLKEEQVGLFSVLGFSLGGRVAINTVKLFSKRVQGLVLLAPDGIIDSFIFKVATRKGILRKVFKRMVFYPKFYNQIIRGVKALNIIDPSSIDFVQRVMSTRSRRYRLYRVWNMYAGLSVDLKSITKVYTGDVKLFLAEKDFFIDTSKVITKCDKIKMPYTLLKTGHFQILNKYFSIYK